jgi:hypothetical protein
VDRLSPRPRHRPLLLADNGDGRDEGSALLAALARAGIVDRIPFPGTPGRPPQLSAYGEILDRHGDDADWIAFIDATSSCCRRRRAGACARSSPPSRAGLPPGRWR